MNIQQFPAVTNKDEVKQTFNELGLTGSADPFQLSGTEAAGIDGRKAEFVNCVNVYEEQ